ncbi:hypothetical protein V6N12_002708 [Hibiscus sabdariffa]|uniref:Uncharacterized protein n=1 Tax=Hibiscus sabdariffa TaxID=183260 RepID=A0ABR2EBA9_9ROSI
MWSGTASSDWAGGGGWGASGVVPMGESGVLSLLAGRSAGVAAGLGIVWLAAGTAWGESAAGWLGLAGAGDVAAGLEDPASLVGAAGILSELASGVGITMLRGVASATSILRMYTALVQPFFSAWYLSLGLDGTAARLHRAEMRQGKARMPLSFEHAAANSLARISPTFTR